MGSVSSRLVRSSDRIIPSATTKIMAQNEKNPLFQGAFDRWPLQPVSGQKLPHFFLQEPGIAPAHHQGLVEIFQGDREIIVVLLLDLLHKVQVDNI